MEVAVKREGAPKCEQVPRIIAGHSQSEGYGDASWIPDFTGMPPLCGGNYRTAVLKPSDAR